MKLWIDDVRRPPVGYGYRWLKSVNEAKLTIQHLEDGMLYEPIEVLDMDYDAGDYAKFGGDYIKLLDWLEETHRNYPIHIHSMNPVGVKNMRRIIKRNGWKEV